MRRELFKSKIHRATVTHADLYCEGSVAVDEDLLVDDQNRAVDRHAVLLPGPARRVTA